MYVKSDQGGTVVSAVTAKRSEWCGVFALSLCTCGFPSGVILSVDGCFSQFVSVW